MRLAGGTLVALCAAWLAAGAQENVNRDSLILKDFEQRVSEYVKLHNNARSDVRGLKPTNSTEAIVRHEHELAARIRESRSGAVPGSIFSPEIAAEFRRLIGLTMRGPEAVRIHESLKQAAPAQLPSIRVNQSYPSSVPLQSTPPSLLMGLPPLPPEVEYRVVGNELVLRDIEANLIVDFISNAIP
jgi:hypothetical protein